jgi:hypothetical protein
MPAIAPPAAMPKQIHSTVPIAGVGRPVRVVPKCSRIGTTMNAATARSNSSIANTRWIEAERSEKPARNSAGVTDAPMPTPVRPEPTSVSVEVGGIAPRSTRIPAIRNTIPVRAK